MTKAPGPPREEGFSKDADKLIRRLSLVAFLLSRPGRPATAAEIRERVEGYALMSDDAFKRRFYEDRAELAGLGIGIVADAAAEGETEVYALPASAYYLPAIAFTPDELSALAACLFVLEHRFAYSEPLRLALLSLTHGRPELLSPAAATPVSVLPEREARRAATALPKLQQAVAAGKTVSFVYYSIGRDEELLRTVDPYGLLLVGDEWYLIAWCHLRRAIRTFRLSRLRSRVTFATRAPHDFSPPPDFTLDDYLDRPAWQLGEPVGRATVRVAADMAWWVEAHFSRCGVITPASADPGAETDVLYSTPYNSEQQLVAWVLSMGEAAELLEPPELRECLGAHLQKLADRLDAPPFDAARAVELLAGDGLAGPRPAPRPQEVRPVARPRRASAAAAARARRAAATAAVGEPPADPDWQVEADRFTRLATLMTYLHGVCRQTAAPTRRRCRCPGLRRPRHQARSAQGRHPPVEPRQLRRRGHARLGRDQGAVADRHVRRGELGLCPPGAAVAAAGRHPAAGRRDPRRPAPHRARRGAAQRRAEAARSTARRAAGRGRRRASGHRRTHPRRGQRRHRSAPPARHRVLVRGQRHDLEPHRRALPARAHQGRVVLRRLVSQLAGHPHLPPGHDQTRAAARRALRAARRGRGRALPSRGRAQLRALRAAPRRGVVRRRAWCAGPPNASPPLPLPDGECLALLPYLDERWLTHEMLRFGGEALPLDPPAAATALRSVVERLLERYAYAMHLPTLVVQALFAVPAPGVSLRGLSHRAPHRAPRARLAHLRVSRRHRLSAARGAGLARRSSSSARRRAPTGRRRAPRRRGAGRPSDEGHRHTAPGRRTCSRGVAACPVEGACSSRRLPVCPPCADLPAAAAEALDAPPDTPRLLDPRRGARSVAVVVPDASRDCPSPSLLPPVLERLARAGVRDEQITVVVGCGLHRTTTAAEKAALVGHARGRPPARRRRPGPERDERGARPHERRRPSA